MARWMERVFVWIGGALFVAALALLAWRYTRGFVRPVTSPSPWAIAIDTWWLSLFAMHHSLFARDGVKRRFERLVPARLLRSVYVWVASLLLIGVCLAWQPIGGTLYRVTGAARLPFLVAQALGGLFVFRAVRAIRVLELAGIEPPRPAMDELQVGGPYRVVRHPLYLGWMLAVGGTAHMTGDRLLFFAVTTAYIVLAIPWEEGGLAAHFGAGYERYRARVRWRLVPYVY